MESIEMTADDALFKRRIEDLARQADEQRFYVHSGFLTPPEQNLYLSVRNELPVRSFLYGGSDSCIRKIVCFGSEEEFGYEWENPVRILHIRPKNEKFAEALTHRDYLGSVMALGIDRKLTGDIIIREKEAWIFVLDTAVEYLSENLVQIRHTTVCCEPAAGEVPELAPQFLNMTVNIASERLDLIIAAAAGLKREQAKKLLDAEKVFVNGRLVSSPGHKLKEGDEFVIRGFGKYIYAGIEGTTKKGRVVVSLKKYC